MKILIVSNMFPSEQKPFSGLFVVNQVKEIEQQLGARDVLDFFYMKRTFTNKIGSLKKYLIFLKDFVLFCFQSPYKYEIIHVHFYFPTIYLAIIYKYLFNKHVKIIVTFHGGDYYVIRKTLFYRYPFKIIDKTIAVSKDLAQSLQKFYSKKIYIIPAGINTIFEPPKEPKNKFIDLIYVGSFYEEKGFDLLCEVLQNINYSLRVCIIGSGPLISFAEKVQKQSFHHIEIYNDLSQIKILEKLHQSSFLINTSRQESFGLSMAEAMACGLPVIATSTDGANQQIINRVNGFLVLENSVKNICDKVEEALNITTEEYRSLSKNAIAGSELFKLPKITSDIIRLYQS